MKLRLAVAAIAATVFLTASPRASAELLTLQLNRTVTGTVTVNLGSKTDNVTPGPYYWSDINDPPNTNFPAPIATFCMELLDPNGQPAGSPTVGASFTLATLTAKSADVTPPWPSLAVMVTMCGPTSLFEGRPLTERVAASNLIHVGSVVLPSSARV